jgi:hypothetical protein
MQIDHVRGKGKQDAETIYALLGGTDLARQEHFLSLQNAFHSMLHHYRANEWQEALLYLERCRAIDTVKQLAKLLDLYSSRIDRLSKSAPSQDWDGVFPASPQTT